MHCGICRMHDSADTLCELRLMPYSGHFINNYLDKYQSSASAIHIISKHLNQNGKLQVIIQMVLKYPDGFILLDKIFIQLAENLTSDLMCLIF